MKINFRLASLADAEFLLECRNDPTARVNFFDQSVVTIPDHLRWLTTKLADPSVRIFIGEVDGDCAGYVRAQRDENGWELSWAVASAYRGKGLGAEFVGMMIDMLPGQRVRASIKAKNISSIRIVERLGFTKVRDEEKNGELVTVWSFIQTPP